MALADYYEQYPVRGKARATTPLFTTDGVTPWTATVIASTLNGIMRATLAPAQRRRKTLHSKRVFCATGLRDLGSSDGEIQALVRWSSLECLRIYARMGLEYQARRRDLLLNANIDAMNAAARSTIPTIDETADELEALPPADADDLAAAFEAAH